jgi:Ca2+-binding EF-hand superfamily protein
MLALTLFGIRSEDADPSEEDVEGWFHDMDINKDLFVDLAEYKSYFSKDDINISVIDLEDAFKLLDKANLGKVDITQWKEFYIQVLLPLFFCFKTFAPTPCRLHKTRSSSMASTAP